MRIEKMIKAIKQADKITIAIPFPYEEDLLSCIAEASKEGLANFLLIGDPSQIQNQTSKHGIAKNSMEIIEASEEKEACDRAATLVKEGRAQTLMKGLVQTSTCLKSILQKDKNLLERGKLISHCAIFEIESFHKPFILTDGAISIAPDIKIKKQILLNAIEFARTLEIAVPKVACLSAIEKLNPAMPSTSDAKELENLGTEGFFGQAIVEGPLAFDCAVSAEAAIAKGIESKVSGAVDILLAPNIEAGNILYKCLTKFMKANPAGIIAGAKIPIIATSRADSFQSKLNSLALGVYLAINN